MSPSSTIHNTNTSVLQKDAIDLLKKLIAIPSFSKEEDKTAIALTQFFAARNIKVNTIKNNIWAANLHFDANKPSILLNSHHDTVKPNKGYTNEPFSPIEKEGKLFGLGANDAGGCLVSLIACFLHFYAMPNLGYNIIFVASAEEEISIVQAYPANKPIAKGKAGHAAREEGENAIYKILADIEWFKNYQFEKVSDLLGKVKMTVTVIDTDNKQHNVVPSTCKMVVDVRVNELYSFEEVLKTIQENIKGEVKPRSVRMRSTSIAIDHVLVKAGKDLGKGHYGSVTTSDKALMPFATLKIGPGDSARSHTADEFIYIKEIEEGIVDYIQLLEKIV